MLIWHSVPNFWQKKMTEDCIPSVQRTKITKNISAFELNLTFTDSIYKF